MTENPYRPPEERDHTSHSADVPSSNAVKIIAGLAILFVVAYESYNAATQPITWNDSVHLFGASATFCFLALAVRNGHWSIRTTIQTTDECDS